MRDLFLLLIVAMVGLERTLYKVSELLGVVEACSVVHKPTVAACPIQFPFSVIFSTADNNAGIIIL